ncbi:hypothetical protein BDW_03460 [Bdellovibrio bacteriovorus W]|nr:hypothetical protein BDW_03460 [Bdellovibrio bacteriovorus W]
MKALLASALISLVSVSAMAKTIPAGTYNIDPAHSNVTFKIRHLVISTVEGRFSKFDGKIVIDPKVEKSKAEMNVDVASINTDNKDRDDHLRSADFFDAAKYPKITFVVKKIKADGDDFKITGDLTIKGKKKEVTLEADYLGDVQDPFGNHKIAFSAEGKISRKDFGITWNNMVEAGPVVGDEVKLVLNIQAAKPVEKK